MCNYADPFGLCKQGVGSLRAYGVGLSVVIECADGSNEVRSGGSRSWRNNNPGNLEAGKFSTSHGAVGSAGGASNNKFAVFADLESGEEARASLLTTGKNYRGLTLGQMVPVYAPAQDGNNVQAYISSLVKQTGISADTRLDALSGAQWNALLSAMRRHEGFKAGTVTYEKRDP